MISKDCHVTLCDIYSKPLGNLSPLSTKSIFSYEKDALNMEDKDKKNSRIEIVKLNFDKPKRKKRARTVQSSSKSSGKGRSIESYLKSSGKSDDEDNDDYQVGVAEQENIDYCSKPKKFKKIDVEESSDDDSEDYFKSVRDGKLSKYEKMVERNRAERMALLQSLNLIEAKEDFVNAVHNIKKKTTQPVKKPEKLHPLPLGERRKSKRLANISVDLSEDAIFRKAVQEAKEAESAEKIPKELLFSQALKYGKGYERYIEDVNIQESKPKFASYDKSVLTNLMLDENNIAKVAPNRTTAVAWYPSPEYLVVAAGSKTGDLGIWNVGNESSPYMFRPHNQGITHLQFNPLNPVQMFTSSYDGSFRCGDMVKHVFSEVYDLSHTGCTYFDFLSEKTCLVAQRNGYVAFVDNRVEGKCSHEYKCHQYAIKTVDVHPVNRNSFITADNKGTICLWDLRKVNHPTADIVHHKKSVNSAFFSPVTGNSILTTSLDDTVAIFDCTQLTDVKLKKIMKHNNWTGRWLSIFRATWLPSSEEAFFIGSMQNPRRIQLYDNNMNVYYILMNEKLTTVTSTIAFHPCRPAIAGCNSSGKVYVFK